MRNKTIIVKSNPININQASIKSSPSMSRPRTTIIPRKLKTRKTQIKQIIFRDELIKQSNFPGIIFKTTSPMLRRRANRIKISYDNAGKIKNKKVRKFIPYVPL